MLCLQFNWKCLPLAPEFLFCLWSYDPWGWRLNLSHQTLDFHLHNYEDDNEILKDSSYTRAERAWKGELWPITRMHIPPKSLHTTNVGNTKSSSLIPDERLVTAWAEHDRCHVLPAPTGWAGQYLNTKIIPRPTRETLDLCKLELTDDIWWRVTRVNVITTHIIAHPLWLHDTFTSSSNSLRNSQRSAITSKVFTKS